jgi:hypothetical protein
MGVLLLLTSPPSTLRAVGGGSAAGPSHSRTSGDVRLESAKWAKTTIRSASLSPYGHPRAAVPQYGRRYHREGTIMKKLSMIGIVGGAALLAAVPFSLQWSQVGPAVPLLTVSHANAQYYGPSRRHVRRVYRRDYRRAYGGYPSSYGGYPSCLGQYPC